MTFLSKLLVLFCIAITPTVQGSEDKTKQKASKELVNILKDDKKREALIEQVKLLSKAQESVEDHQESTIHELNGKLVEYVELSAQALFKGAHILAAFPKAVWDTLALIKLRDVQDKVLDFILVIFFALSLGSLVEFTLRFFFNRFVVIPKPPLDLWRFTSYIILTIIPMLGFAITASFIAYFLEKPYILEEVVIVISAIFMVRLLLKYFRVLLQPHHTALRIIPMSDRSAQRFYRLVGIFAQILVLGTILGQILHIFGLPEEHYQAFKGIVAFGLLITFAVLVLDYKRPIAHWLKQDDAHLDGTPRIFLSMTHILSRTWHIITIGLLVSLYVAWLYKALDNVMYLSRSILLTILLLVTFRFINHKLSYYGHKWANQIQDMLSHSDEDIEFVNSWKHAKSVPVLQSAYFLVPVGQFFLYLATLVLGLMIWGLDLLQILAMPTVKEYMLTGFAIILVVIFARVLWGLIDLVSGTQLQTNYIRGQAVEPSLFAKTIIPIMRSTLKGVVAFIGLLVILSELSVEIKPILYAFSVISLAISFGAQTMVKDVITGFLTLFEGNIAVGEVVTIGPHSGTVEAISLRSVFIRHGNGALQSIPFSEVTHVINKSRDYTVSLFEVSSAHAVPLEAIFKTLEQTYEEMKQITPWKNMITDTLKISGVDRFSDTGIVVQATVRTKPDPKGNFRSAFNARLQENLRMNNIKPPMQQQIVFNATATEALA